MKVIPRILVVICFITAINIIITQAQEYEPANTSLLMPLSIDHLRPITSEIADEVIQLGWYRPDEYLGDNLIYAATISPNGQYVASGGSSNILTIWDTANNTHFKISLDGAIHAIAFSGDSQLIAVATTSADYQNMNVKIWQMNNFELIFSSEIEESLTTILLDSSGKQLVAIPEYEGNGQVFDVVANTISQTLPLHQYAYSAIYSPDYSRLIVSARPTTRIFSVDDFSRLAIIPNGLSDIDISSDGRMLVDAGGNLYDAISGEYIGGTGVAGTAVFGADNQTIISTIYFGGINIVNAQDGILHTLPFDGVGALSSISINTNRTLFVVAHLTSDVLLYGAPNCAVRAAQRTNLRTDATTTSAVGGALQTDELGFVIGQSEDEFGFTWWQLSNSLWVRSDIVSVASGCHED